MKRTLWPTASVVCACLLLGSPPVALADWQEPAITPGKALSLEEALRLADARNLSLQAARTDIAAAQARLKSAWAQLLPVAAGSLTLTHNDHATTATIGGQKVDIGKPDDLRGSVRVDLPLVHLGLWQGPGLGELGVDLSRLQVEQVRQQMLLAVTQTFLQALSARNLVEVQRAYISAIERQLQVATVRHRSGTGPRLDVVRARTELIAARQELIAAITAVENTRDALATLVGLEEWPEPIALTGLAVPQSRPDEMIKRALARREDVRLAGARVQVADQQLSATWMQFFPSLNASWQLNQQISDPGGLSSSDKSRWFIGLTLSVPIYDHERYAQLDEMRAELDRVTALLEDTRRQAALAVRQALRAYQQALAAESLAGSRAELAQESLKLSETAYAVGTGSSLEVTDPQRVDRQAEIDRELRRLDTQLALMELLRSLGDDLSSLAGSDTRVKTP